MDSLDHRVLAYDLATALDPIDLDQIAGGRGGPSHMPTIQPTGDVLSLDMTLDY